MSILSDFSQKKESHFPSPVTEPASQVTAPFSQQFGHAVVSRPFFQNEDTLDKGTSDKDTPYEPPSYEATGASTLKLDVD